MSKLMRPGRLPVAFLWWRAECRLWAAASSDHRPGRGRAKFRAGTVLRILPAIGTSEVASEIGRDAFGLFGCGNEAGYFSIATGLAGPSFVIVIEGAEIDPPIGWQRDIFSLNCPEGAERNEVIVSRGSQDCDLIVAD